MLSIATIDFLNEKEGIQVMPIKKTLPKIVYMNVTNNGRKRFVRSKSSLQTERATKIKISKLTT